MDLSVIIYPKTRKAQCYICVPQRKQLPSSFVTQQAEAATNDGQF